MRNESQSKEIALLQEALVRYIEIDFKEKYLSLATKKRHKQWFRRRQAIKISKKHSCNGTQIKKSSKFTGLLFQTASWKLKQKKFLQKIKNTKTWTTGNKKQEN